MERKETLKKRMREQNATNDALCCRIWELDVST